MGGGGLPQGGRVGQPPRGDAPAVEALQEGDAHLWEAAQDTLHSAKLLTMPTEVHQASCFICAQPGTPGVSL